MKNAQTFTVTFNHQQLALLDVFIDKDPTLSGYKDLVKRAIDEAAQDNKTANDNENLSTGTKTIPAPPVRRILSEYIIEPGQGRAIEVPKGKIIRVEQIIGGQCADLNIFNLNNKHEHLHVGRTRTLHGLNPGAGDLVWSNAPWERPLMAILANTSQTDTLFPYCSAMIYSHFFGICEHTNCQFIQTEAQREYGLAPYDLHESLNLFMYSKVDSDGVASIQRNESRAGDYIEFAALMDVLFVTNVCGDDYGKTSNFWMKPLKAVVMEACEEDEKFVESSVLKADQTKNIKPPYLLSDDPLSRKADYRPAWSHLPIHVDKIHVELSAGEKEKFKSVHHSPLYSSLYSDDEDAALRDIMMSWVGRRMDW